VTSPALPERPHWPCYSEVESLHHVVYEFDMLDFTAGWLQARAQDQEWGAGQALTNAVLESFALHLRNIIEFMGLKTAQRGDDLRADAFVADVDGWRAERDAISFDHRAAWSRANKRVAHLTETRRDPADKAWPLAVVMPIRLQEAALYRHLRPEHRRPPFRQTETCVKVLITPTIAATSASIGISVSSGALATP
jgi:hypothetical protein